ARKNRQGFHVVHRQDGRTAARQCTRRRCRIPAPHDGVHNRRPDARQLLAHLLHSRRKRCEAPPGARDDEGVHGKIESVIPSGARDLVHCAPRNGIDPSSRSWDDSKVYRNRSSDFLNTCPTPHASGTPTSSHAVASNGASARSLPTAAKLRAGNAPDCRLRSSSVASSSVAAKRASTARISALHTKPTTRRPA